jgi:hypothetical protein
LTALVLAVVAAVSIRQAYVLVDSSKLEFPDLVRPVADLSALLALLVAMWLSMELGRSRRLHRLVRDTEPSRRTAAAGTVLLLVVLAFAASHLALDSVFDTRSKVLPLVALTLGALLAMRWLLASQATTPGRAASLAPFVLLAVGAAALSNDFVRFAFFERSVLMGSVARSAGAAFDVDGDGAAGPWLLGADCSPFDPQRGPSVREVVGDGIDQDCRAGDQAATPWPPRSSRGPWAECLAVFRERVERPHVLLLTLDAVRWDSFQRWAPTPFVQLAATSAYFQNAYTTSPRTEHSIPALLSGRYLSDMGTGNRLAEAWIKPDLPLVSALRGIGYRASAISSLRPAWFAEYFDDYGGGDTDPFADAKFGYTSGAFAAVAARRLANASDRPLFLWLHQLDPHAPYDPIRRESFPHPDADDYERAVAYTLLRTGTLLAQLSESRRRDDTVIVVASDHGEELGEQGRHGHGGNLVETAIRVPLILHVPGCPGVEVERPVSLVDVAPTLGELTGVWSANWSLLDAIGGTPNPLPVVSEVPFGGRLERAVVGQHAKLRIDVGTGARIASRRNAEGGENQEVNDAAPEAAAELEAAYDRWLGRQPSWRPQ